MKKRLLYLLSCGFALATGPSATAAPRATTPPPQPFVLESTARPPASRWLVPDAIEEFRIQVDPEAVAANPEVLAIDLPDGSRLEAVRTRFIVYRPDWKSWSGTLRYVGATGPGTGYVNFGLHGSQLTALIDFEGERYRIVGNISGDIGGNIGGKGQRLVRLSDDLSPRPCGLDEDTPGDADSEPLFPREKPQAKKTAQLPNNAKATSTRIDVLVVYPSAFFSRAAAVESSIRTFAQESIAMANDIFANSGIDAAYNLVAVVPLTSTQPSSTGLQSALSWINASGPGGAPALEVTTLRDAFGADVVTMFIPFEWDGTNACGLAIVPIAGGGYSANPQSPFGDRAFTVERLNCGLGDFTVAHEIGHNYGMRHHNSDADDKLFTYGKGYVFPPEAPAKATVMGCFCTGCECDNSCPLGSGAVCNRIPSFSDPNRTYQGQTIGTSNNNNVEVGRIQAPAYALFRPQSANTPPDANFTRSCTNLTCTFDASFSTDDAAIPSTGYWWDFGDGSTGTGRTISHTYQSQLAERVHLVVTDSGGQTDVEWQPGQGTVPGSVILTATATGFSQISLTWTASAGATSYEVRRKSDGGSYQTIATPAGNSYTDTVSSNKTYVYAVRALNASGASGWSVPDLATTFFFTDDPVTAGGIVKAVHLTQLRQAVNLVRAAAGLSGSSFTDLAPTVIKAIHIGELRSALDQARNALGVQALVYTNSTLAPLNVVRAAHIQELRAGVK